MRVLCWPIPAQYVLHSCCSHTSSLSTAELPSELHSISLLQQQHQPRLRQLLPGSITPLLLLLLGCRVLLLLLLLLLLLQAEQLLQQRQVDAASAGGAAQHLTQQLLCCRPLVCQQLPGNHLQATAATDASLRSRMHAS
jgi:hypothetical protein